MRTIGVVTTSRADYGIYLPLLRGVAAEPELELRLFVTGMHLLSDYGRTVEAIEKDGFEIAARVDGLLQDDSPEGIGRSMGRVTGGFANALTQSRPDLLLVLGDRFEMHAAALAAVPARIPLAHIHGGEVTEGAFDEGFRHSLTKLSHLHFVASDDAARRVRQLGEEPWRIVRSGAPALDHLAGFKPLPLQELNRRFGFFVDDSPLLVTFHPPTLDSRAAWEQQEELLAVLQTRPEPIVLTAPNADTGGRELRARLEVFARERARTWLAESLGTEGYFSLMARSAAMVGNSSSGLIEAPSFALPVVNIGDRQKGRVRAANVIDVPCDKESISRGIDMALTPAFRKGLQGLVNPYGEGNAAERIIQTLRAAPLGEVLLKKRFCDWEEPRA